MVNVVAHRGFSGKYPENTEIAFKKALELGVELIELDLRLTKDKHLVVIHDETVDRTSDGHGEVAELTLAEMKKLDFGRWYGEEFAGQRIMIFEELLELVERRARLNVHIKTNPALRSELVERAIRTMVAHGYLESAYIASDEKTIKLAKEVEPAVETCNLTNQPVDTYVQRSIAVGATILQPRNRPGKERLERSLVEEAHKHDLEVNPYYADDIEEMKRLIACGVDGILTNHPDRLIKLRQELAL